MDYRQGVMAEALAQRDSILPYYAGLLTFGRSSHPATWRLAKVASRVGQFQAMYYKAQFNRPRASMLSPNLVPPIAVPGHASYPSGHATESRLLSNVLSQVMPAAVSTGMANLSTVYGLASNDPNYPYSWPQAALMRLAERIARNREVLGLHYPSDSKAGVYLADQTFILLLPFLQNVLRNTTTTNFLIAEAKAEWP
jgi:membrane-associated phospholipid phosphatase